MDKKAALLQSALELFVENGFHGSATSKIAQHAGVANGTLFNYFKTKDQLVITLYLELKHEMAEFILKNTHENHNIKEMMKSQFLASLFWALDNKLKFRFIQQFHASPYLNRVTNEVVKSQAAPHIALIQEGIDKGLIKKLPADMVYTLISSQAFGVYQYLQSNDLTKVQQHAMLEQTFELLWKMLS